MKFGFSLFLLAISGVELSSASKSRAAAVPRNMHRKPIQSNLDSYDEEIDALISRTNSASHSLSPVNAKNVRGGSNNALQQKMKVGFYFALWYALNVIYNSEYK